MPAKLDNRILSLINEVKKQKAEISAIEHPVWQTNLSFSPDEKNLNGSMNLHTVTSVKTLLSVAGFLIGTSQDYINAGATLGIPQEELPAFTWQGFTLEAWLSDIGLRINKVQIASKREKLAKLEERLNSIVSPELRAQIELEAIEAELK